MLLQSDVQQRFVHVLPCVLLGHTKLICCHICVSCLLRDMACQASCECLPVCVSTGSVWQAKERLVKECDSGATYRGHHPKDPRGALYNSTLHAEADMLFTQGHWGLVACVFNSPPPASSPFFLEISSDLKTNLAKKTNKWDKYKHSWTLTGVQIKERRRRVSFFFSEEMGLRSKWTNERGFQIGTGVRWRACVEPRVRVSAVCSDQTHWCVIGSLLSRWPLRLNVCRGGGQEEVALMIMRYRWHTHTHTGNTLCKWHKCVESFTVYVCVRAHFHTNARLSLPLLSCL